MSQIRVSDLSFAYPGSYDAVFEHVSFTLDTDWKLGFVGRNGRGKTTFLHLLDGTLDGRGSIRASVAFSYFPFPVPDPELTTLSVLEEISGALAWQIRRELALLDVTPDAEERPFSTLSMGERTKCLLAALFLKPHNFLLIDEPTNHLDMPARALVSRYLAGKRGFILVSHDRAFLDGCVDHILSINRANIEVRQGNYTSYAENRRRQDQFEQSENDRLQKEITGLRAASERAAAWSESIERTKIGQHVADRGHVGTQSARMMQRAKAIERRTESAAKAKETLLKNVERNENLSVTPLVPRAELLIESRDLVIQYGARPVFAPESFAVRRGERIAITGKNGAGKSSILKLLVGEDVPHTGTLRLCSGLVLSYLPQDTSFLAGDPVAFAKASGVDLTRFLTVLRKLDFPRVQFEKDMASYSAGQKKKVLLAKSLCESAHLYVWDEPLNYVDVLSRIQIEELLLGAKPAMLFVEHDRAFVDAVATRVIEL